MRCALPTAFPDCDFYHWHTVTVDGGLVRGSNGIELKPDHSIATLPQIRYPVCLRFLACSTRRTSPKFSPPSAHKAGAAAGLGGIVLGTILLAEAGQLDGYRCTVHWENRAAFLERFPDVECTGNVFEIDRKRYTCAGGTTAH